MINKQTHKAEIRLVMDSDILEVDSNGVLFLSSDDYESDTEISRPRRRVRRRRRNQ